MRGQRPTLPRENRKNREYKTWEKNGKKPGKTEDFWDGKEHPGNFPESPRFPRVEKENSQKNRISWAGNGPGIPGLLRPRCSHGSGMRFPKFQILGAQIFNRGRVQARPTWKSKKSLEFLLGFHGKLPKIPGELLLESPQNPRKNSPKFWENGHKSLEK